MLPGRGVRHDSTMETSGETFSFHAGTERVHVRRRIRHRFPHEEDVRGQVSLDRERRDARSCGHSGNGARFHCHKRSHSGGLQAGRTHGHVRHGGGHDHSSARYHFSHCAGLSGRERERACESSASRYAGGRGRGDFCRGVGSCARVCEKAGRGGPAGSGAGLCGGGPFSFQCHLCGHGVHGRGLCSRASPLEERKK